MPLGTLPADGTGNPPAKASLKAPRVRHRRFTRGGGHLIAGLLALRGGRSRVGKPQEAEFAVIRMSGLLEVAL